jgi:uncharacterized protein YcfJ
MSTESKKMLVWLGGFTGLAVIIVLTTLVMKLILNPNTAASTPAVAPAQQTTAAAAAPAPAASATPAFAQVISVKPHYVSVSVPKESCHETQHVVYVEQQSQAPGAGAVIGGVTGGLLGSTVGGGNGRIVTSAAGAVIGAFTGNSMQNSMNTPEARTIYGTRCKTYYSTASRQKGYEVTYSYNGTQGVVVMDNAPMVGSGLPLPLS